MQVPADKTKSHIETIAVETNAITISDRTIAVVKTKQTSGIRAKLYTYLLLIANICY